MKYGFIKVCSAVHDMRVADCKFNTEKIINAIKEASREKAKVIVFPELCVCGYTCGELFLQDALISGAKAAVTEIAKATKKVDALCIIGAPIEAMGTLYNCAVAIYKGEILAIIPKKKLSALAGNFEQRYFKSADDEIKQIVWDGKEIPFGTDIIIGDKNIKNFTLMVQISGAENEVSAMIVANLSADGECAGSAKMRKDLILARSKENICGYICAGAGKDESTTDAVYGGDRIICENGVLLNRGELFENGLLFSEIDVDLLANDRRTKGLYVEPSKPQRMVMTEFELGETKITRTISPNPFMPEDESEKKAYLEEILKIQAFGLAKRLAHTNTKTVVIGVSGGLDSTLALLATRRAFDILGLDTKNIMAVTMPCFGTTKRTKNNAVLLTEKIGATLKEIDITKSVELHFEDIDHDKNTLDVTYENAQARERMQVLMDIANKIGALVVGTGDMSELALGWATYNGDHMSMYGTNAGVTKTLIRFLVEYVAEKDEHIRDVLKDILDTPVSPELLPAQNGEISQKTEQFVGPYILHDFFLYYMLGFGFTPSKIFHLAKIAFFGVFEKDEILKWMKVFYRRFFAQQFKRSCMPDGPKTLLISLSPRSGLHMPSDACCDLWLNEVENLK